MYYGVKLITNHDINDEDKDIVKSTFLNVVENLGNHDFQVMVNELLLIEATRQLNNVSIQLNKLPISYFVRRLISSSVYYTSSSGKLRYDDSKEVDRYFDFKLIEVDDEE